MRRQGKTMERVLILLLGIALGVAAPAFAGTPFWGVDSAQAAYEAGKYEQALRIYEGILSRDGSTAALLFNIGNCQLKLNRIGRAIAAYQEALRLAPRDSDIRYNLDRAREMRKDAIEGSDEIPFFRFLGLWHTGFSRNESAALGFLLYFLAAAFACVWLLEKRRGMATAAAVLLCFAFLFWGSALWKRHMERNPSRGVVVSEKAEVRSGTGTVYGVAFNLHDGAEVRVEEVAEKWAKIRLSGDKRGWISKDDMVSY